MVVMMERSSKEFFKELRELRKNMTDTEKIAQRKMVKSRMEHKRKMRAKGDN